MFMPRDEYSRNGVLLQRNAAPVRRDARLDGLAVQKWLNPSLTNYVYSGNDEPSKRGRPYAGTVRENCIEVIRTAHQDFQGKIRAGSHNLHPMEIEFNRKICTSSDYWNSTA